MTEPTLHPAHYHLIEMGFDHQYIDAEWEDTGGPESGPIISGHPGFHLYKMKNFDLYINNDGSDTGYQMFNAAGWPVAASY